MPKQRLKHVIDYSKDLQGYLQVQQMWHKDHLNKIGYTYKR